VLAASTFRGKEVQIMPVQFNHTIVWAHDSAASAAFLARMLGLRAPERWGPFQVVATANGVNVDFMEKEGEIRTQHYAFLVDEPEFDAIFGRIQEEGLPFWADPGRTKKGEINHHDGGRGVYYEDPNGHLLEVITRSYGSGGWNP
jgi:catechol 2,3-dioxygenase-like lactoylglutathione lyase family enzyme